MILRQFFSDAAILLAAGGGDGVWDWRGKKAKKKIFNFIQVCLPFLPSTFVHCLP